MPDRKPSDELVKLILEVQGPPEMPRLPKDASIELKLRAAAFMDRMRIRMKKSLKMLIEEHLSDDDIGFMIHLYQDPTYRRIAPKFQDVCSRALASVMEDIMEGVIGLQEAAEEEGS